MLKINVDMGESYDETTQQFVTTHVPIELEHSLYTLSKWEEVWEKPFLSPDAKSQDETVSYIKTMITTPDVPPEVFARLSKDDYTVINKYIEGKMSATWFAELPGKPRGRETITAEIIYYWMVSFNIPAEYDRWHLNKLFTLLRVFNDKQAPAKKMSKQDLAARNRRLNEERKAKLNTTG